MKVKSESEVTIDLKLSVEGSLSWCSHFWFLPIPYRSLFLPLHNQSLGAISTRLKASYSASVILALLVPSTVAGI